MARTFVSFDADEDTFASDGDPAGRELADFLHAALHQAGSEPEKREGWAWDVANIRWRTAEDDYWASTPG